MVNFYEVEIITPKGNRWAKSRVSGIRESFKSILDARKRAIREITEKDIALIHEVSQSIPGWLNITVERVEYDEYIGDYTVQQYTTHRRYRVSPKTGKLLDFNREWKYL